MEYICPIRTEAGLLKCGKKWATIRCGVSSYVVEDGRNDVSDYLNSIS